MEKLCCIYKITSPSGKVYVGQTVNLYLREIHYRKGHAHKQKKLFSSFKKYGYENHQLEVIEKCSRKLLNEREIYWIKKYNSFHEGMNLTTGGDSKYKLSKSARLALSVAKRGAKNPMYGKVGWNRGKKMSASYRKKLSDAHKGKMMGDQNPTFGGYVVAKKDGNIIGIYQGINDAARSLNIHRENISKVVRGLRPRAGGYQFIRLPKEA